jgi:sulfite exporter TauE/SafE
LALKTPAFKAVGWLKSAFARLLQRRSFASLLLLGGINGLLPCGLVYAACAGAIASGGFLSGVVYMAAFGFGTLPMMLGLSLAGRKLQIAIGPKLQRLVPASLAVMGVLLLCRGLSLGIPYLSPDLSGGEVKCSACHPEVANGARLP